MLEVGKTYVAKNGNMFLGIARNGNIWHGRLATSPVSTAYAWDASTARAIGLGLSYDLILPTPVVVSDAVLEAGSRGWRDSDAGQTADRRAGYVAAITAWLASPEYQDWLKAQEASE